MTTDIDIKRADIKQYFDENAKILEAEQFELSEYGMYYFEAQQYHQTDPKRNWIVTKIQIGHIEKEGHFFEYLTDNDDNCFLWVCKDNKDYLLLPEFQGGQSIFDVAEQRLYSYYSEDDSFIWINIHISPNKTKLAVTGCYWACPFEIVVYDCANLTGLPYLCIYRQWLEHNFQIQEWVDNETLLIVSNKKEEQCIKIL